MFQLICACIFNALALFVTACLDHIVSHLCTSAGTRGEERVIVFSMYDTILRYLNNAMLSDLQWEKNSIMKGTLSDHCHEELLKQLDTTHASHKVIVKQRD